MDKLIHGDSPQKVNPFIEDDERRKQTLITPNPLAMHKIEDGYRIYARWPKSVSPSSPDWEPWTQVFANTTDAKIAHKRFISLGAGKYYYFGLFYLDMVKPKRLIRILSKPNKGK